jgi:hypothetical protein
LITKLYFKNASVNLFMVLSWCLLVLLEGYGQQTLWIFYLLDMYQNAPWLIPLLASPPEMGCNSFHVLEVAC